MARISDDTRTSNEEAIRAAIDRLLRGDLPQGGKADLKTLAAEAGVTRTGFYPKKNRDGTTRPGPYQHLAKEFERRLKALQDAGEIVDPRDGQIARLRATTGELKERVAKRDARIGELVEFQTMALSRLAAQHDEIQRLRRALTHPENITTLPVRARVNQGRPNEGDE